MLPLAGGDHGALGGVRAWTERRLRMQLRLVERRMRSHQVLIMRGLAALIEGILASAGVLPWLNSLQTVSNATGLRSSQHLFPILLKNARQLYASSRL